MDLERSLTQHCKRCHNLLSPSEQQGNGRYCTDCLLFKMNLVSSAPPVEREALDVWLQRWGLPSTTPLTFVYSPSEALNNSPVGYHAESVFAPCTGQAWSSPWKIRLPADLKVDETMTREMSSHWPDGIPLVDMLGEPLPPEYQDLLIEVRFRVWRPGAPTFLETRWDPDSRQHQYHVCNFDPTTVMKDLDDLLKVVRACAPRGRPRFSTGSITSREMLEQYIRDAIHATKSAPKYTRKRVTQQDVVDNSVYFGSVRELRRQYDHWGISWQDFRTELR